MRPAICLWSSSWGSLLLIKPRTTDLCLGRWAKGSKLPARGVSSKNQYGQRWGGTFKVISITVDFLKEFDGDGIISSLRKVDSSLEVSTAQVQADSHVVFLARKTIVVKFDVGIQNLVRVDTNFLHALNHADGTEVSEQWIINLNVPAPRLVQIGNFLTVCLGNIGKVTLLIGVSFLGECIVTVTQMEPFRCRLSSASQGRGIP